MLRRSWLHVPPSGLDLDAAGGTTVDDHAQLILVRGTWEGTPLVGMSFELEPRPGARHGHLHRGVHGEPKSRATSAV